MPSGKIEHHPVEPSSQGSAAIMSQAWLKPVPAPRTRHEVRASHSVGLSPTPDRSEHPLPGAKGGCAGEGQDVRADRNTGMLRALKSGM